MKRFGHFLLLLIAFIIIAYAQPIIFPKQEAPSVTPKPEEADVTVSHTSFPYGKIKASGLASFIGQAPQDLTKIYGEPLEIQETNLGYAWWILGENEADYLQVAVRQNKIISIFVLGQDIDSEPFKIGMSLGDISEVTTIYSNFDFDYQEQHYKFELSEEDMNYRPLVAYDNDTFAILHLDQGTGKLSAIRYLNKQVLLDLMPYQLNEGQLPVREVPLEKEMATINNDRQRQLQTILNLLRQRNDLSPYIYQPELKTIGENSLAKFIAKPSEILTSPERLKEWENNKKAHSFNHPFSLTGEEFDKLLTTSKIETDGVHGLVYGPNYDVPYLALSWYSESQFNRQLTHQDDLGVGAVFANDLVLFLFSEKEAKDLMILEKIKTNTATSSTSQSSSQDSQEENQ